MYNIEQRIYVKSDINEGVDIMHTEKCVECGKKYEVAGWDRRNRRTCGDYNCKTGETRRRARERYLKFKAVHRGAGFVVGNLEKDCLVCGKKFGARRGGSKYCSDACRKVVDRTHSKKYYNKNKKREEREVTCLGCDTNFKTVRKGQLFCKKEECRKKANSYYANRCINKNNSKERRGAGKARSAASRHIEKEQCLVCG